MQRAQFPISSIAIASFFGTAACSQNAAPDSSRVPPIELTAHDISPGHYGAFGHPYLLVRREGQESSRLLIATIDAEAHSAARDSVWISNEEYHAPGGHEEFFAALHAALDHLGPEQWVCRYNLETRAKSDATTADWEASDQPITIIGEDSACDKWLPAHVADRYRHTDDFEAVDHSLATAIGARKLVNMHPSCDANRVATVSVDGRLRSRTGGIVPGDRSNTLKGKWYVDVFEPSGARQLPSIPLAGPAGYDELKIKGWTRENDAIIVEGNGSTIWVVDARVKLAPAADPGAK